MAIKTFKNYPNTETPLNANNINEVITTILEILGLDVDTYSPSTSYSVDDFVVYQKELWRCTNETTGTWNEEDWVKDSILVQDYLNSKLVYGGLIEVGTTVNGSFEKYADGRLIQRGTGSCPAGVGYAEIIFPTSFVDTEYIMLANHKYTGGGSHGGSLQLRNITNPHVDTEDTAFIYSYTPDGGIANYIRNVQYVAYGRWK